jgi:hypothetical protein
MEDDAPKWVEVYSALKNHMGVELCDPAGCGVVISILRGFLYDPVLQEACTSIMSIDSDGTPPPLFGTMVSISPTQTCLLK